MKLPNNSSLDLSNSDTRTLPSDVFDYPCLSSLDISGTLITSLPTQVAVFKKLKEVKMNYMQMEHFPEVLTTLISLEELSLTHCAVENLPISMGKLVSLKSLDLSYCQFRTFPEQLYLLPNLEVLNFSYQEVGDISCCISQELPKLKRLSLEGICRPKITIELPQLEELNLRMCSLSSFEDIIQHTPNLKHLNLMRNDFDKLPTALSSLTSLTSIGLDLDCLDSESRAILKDLPNLEKIEVDNDYGLPW